MPTITVFGYAALRQEVWKRLINLNSISKKTGWHFQIAASKINDTLSGRRPQISAGIRWKASRGTPVRAATRNRQRWRVNLVNLLCATYGFIKTIYASFSLLHTIRKSQRNTSLRPIPLLQFGECEIHQMNCSTSWVRVRINNSSSYLVLIFANTLGPCVSCSLDSSKIALVPAVRWAICGQYLWLLSRNMLGCPESTI